MNVLITGGDGYVGSSVKNALQSKHNVIAISRRDFDLRSRDNTNAFFQNKYFDVVIHTAIKGGSRLQPDTDDMTHDNLSMFYNLYNNKNHYKSFINIGSGAEVGLPTTPYGLSKSIISKLIEQESNFYNVRVYAVFDENELSTRFIKANLFRYIAKQPMIIDQDKYMDFYYMKDLIMIINYYISNINTMNNLPKLFNCCYKQPTTLRHITEIINELSDYKVDVQVLNEVFGDPYVGAYNMPIVDNVPCVASIGLTNGIKHTYNSLLRK